MYKIFADNNLLCTSQDEKTLVQEPVVYLAVNKAGTFTFTMDPTHAFYGQIEKHKTIIKVERDGELLFQGIAVSEDLDFMGNKTIGCEGELTYLNDSIQRPHKYTDQTVQSLLSAYLAVHNAQVDSYKQFELGDVDVTGSNSILRYTNYENTMKEIQEDLIDNFGGYISVRYANGHKYIDYRAGSPRTNTQVIELGKNLIDYTSNLDTSDICTVLIPLGAKTEETEVEGLETRVTIESVNSNKDYLESAAGIAAYGKVVKVQTWDDVHEPSILKSKGQQWLTDQQFDNIVISCSAVDLSYIDRNIERFHLLDTVRIKSAKHGMDRYFLLTEMTVNLNEPGADTFTFGKTEQASLTAKSNQTNTSIQNQINGIPAADKTISEAVQLATALISGAEGGYVLIDRDANGQPYRILVMDNNDKDRATNVIQINKNGIGFSTNGINGPYKNAWTIDGKLLASFIQGGTISVGDQDGKVSNIQAVDADGNPVTVMNSQGISQSGAYIDRYGRTVSKNVQLAAANLIFNALCGNTTYIGRVEMKDGYFDPSSVAARYNYLTPKMVLSMDDRDYSAIQIGENGDGVIYVGPEIVSVDENGNIVPTWCALELDGGKRINSDTKAAGYLRNFCYAHFKGTRATVEISCGAIAGYNRSTPDPAYGDIIYIRDINDNFISKVRKNSDGTWQLNLNFEKVYVENSSGLYIRDPNGTGYYTLPNYIKAVMNGTIS